MKRTSSSLRYHGNAALARVVVTGLAVCVAGAGPVRAQTAGTPMEERLDCLIEPRVVAKLSTPVEGIVADVLVDRGDRVRRGEVVARLDSGVEEAAAEVARIQAANTYAVESRLARTELLKRKRDRAQSLQRGNIVAEAAFDEAATEARIAELEAQEAELSLRLAQAELARSEEILQRRTITSPIDGIITERTLSAGEFAYEQAPIVTVAQIDPLHVEVFAPLGLYRLLRVGMQAEVEPEAPIGGRYIATVTAIDQVFDSGSSTFGVRLELPNPDRALPAGLHCKLRFLSG